MARRTLTDKLMNSYCPDQHNEVPEDVREIQEMPDVEAHDPAQLFPTRCPPTVGEGAATGDNAPETHDSGGTGTLDVGAAETKLGDGDEVMSTETDSRLKDRVKEEAGGRVGS